ncbi:MAG: TonB-dependent receptor [Polyangia bacterium]
MLTGDQIGVGVGVGVLKGVVRQKGTREPLPGVRIVLTLLPEGSGGGPREVVTDPDGQFQLAGLVPGDYRVVLRGREIQPGETRETVGAQRRKLVTYYVPRRAVPFESVVRAEPLRREVSEQVLDANELKRIPGTQNDPVKAVQNLPGVARAPVTGGQLVIWGAAPRETGVYADGMMIPAVFHVGGLRSTINAEFVSELSFKPGAYGADYGRSLGGIVELKLRSPRSDRVHGSVTLDLIDGAVTLEGPITKNLHVAAGARVSWISAFLPLFSVSSYQLAPFYWDYQLALRYRPGSRDDLDLFILGSSDRLGIRSEDPDPVASLTLETQTYFSRVSLRWVHRFSPGSSLTVLPFLGGSTARAGAGDRGLGGIPLSSDSVTFDYGLRAELQHRLARFLHLSVGLDLFGYRSTFDVLTTPQLAALLADGSSDRPADAAAQPIVSAIRETTVLNEIDVAPYAIARFELWSGRLIVSPQIRLAVGYQQAYDGARSSRSVTPEPRLFVSLQLLPRWLRLKLGLGTFSHTPAVREVSQAYGNPLLGLQYGAVYVAGLESEPTPTLSLQGQLFFRDLRSLVVPDPVSIYSNDGLGRTLGADFLIRQRLWRGLFGWVAYTVSRSERRDGPGQPWRPFQFDQTHILTLIVSYKLPWTRLGIEVGVRFRYVTGNPSTPVTGAVRDLSTQSWAPTQGPLYSERLPDFHQLDLRVDKTWIFNRWKLGLYLDLQNLYNRVNTEQQVYGGRQLSQSSPVAGLPFFPNLGARAEF